MVLRALERIFGFSFRSNIQVENVNLIDKEDADKFKKEGSSLHLNVNKLSEQEIAELQEVPPNEFEKRGRVLREKEEVEATAIKQGYTDSFSEVTDFFDGILSDRYLQVIDIGLHLRALIAQHDLSKEEIQEKKRQISQNYRGNSVYLVSLTTAGYFDPNGGIRDLLVEMELNPQYERFNFQKELQSLVENKILCIFIENDDEIREATNEIRGRIARYQREDPAHDWLDIRGIGSGCEEIIEEVIENLEDEFVGLDHQQWKEDDQKVVRIRPHTLPPIEE